MIAFVSDNGFATGNASIRNWRPQWPKEVPMGSAGPLRGNKGQMLEGGTRTPFILHWPNGLQAGQVYRRPVMQFDLYPTFCAAAQAPLPPRTRLDGADLLPYLRSQKTGDPHTRLFWKVRGSGAIRQGDWKLFVPGGEAAPRLSDLKSDIGETRDRALQNPELARRLHQSWLQWSAPLPPPASSLHSR